MKIKFTIFSLALMMLLPLAFATTSSTSVTPPSTYTVQSPLNSVPSSNISSENYNTLMLNGVDYSSQTGSSACPGTGSNLSNGSYPLCPNINGQFDPNDPAILNGLWVANGETPAQAAATALSIYNNHTGMYPAIEAELCPDSCTVTRAVTGSPITAISDAVCPIGYSQVASFNMQAEIVKSGTQIKSAQISSLGILGQLTSNGFTCTTDSSFTAIRYDLCMRWSGSPTNPPGTGFGINANTNTYGYQYSPGYPYITVGGIGGGGYGMDPAASYVGLLAFVGIDQNVCYPNSLCNGTGQTCASGSYQNYEFSLSRIVCTCQNTYCYTANIVPTTIVCARNKPAWRGQ